MDSRKLVGKIAADKDSNKLGKIIRIELMSGKTVKKTQPYAMILVFKPFRKEFIVPIEAEKAMKVDAQYAWFNITKEEFEEEKERIKKERLDKELYRGDTAVEPFGRRRLRPDYLNLGPARKERKK